MAGYMSYDRIYEQISMALEPRAHSTTIQKQTPDVPDGGIADRRESNTDEKISTGTPALTYLLNQFVEMNKASSALFQYLFGL